MVPATEVTAVSNKIHDLIIQAEVTPKPYDRLRLRAEALTRSCQFLKKLSERQDDFSLSDNYARALARVEPEVVPVRRIGEPIAQAVIDLVSNESTSFDFFLKLEYGLLVDSGLEEGFARWIVKTIRETIGEVKSQSTSPDDLLRSLRILERYVCIQSERLLASVERDYWRVTMLGGFGGIALVTVNLAAGGFLSTLGIGASSAIGTAFLGQSARRLLEA